MDQGEDNQDIEEFLNLEELEYEQEDWFISEEYQKYDLFNNIYDTLCVIQYDIVNKKMDMGLLNERIKYTISLIKQQECEMPICILIKLTQASQLLQQLNPPIIDDCIIEYQQFVKKYEKCYNKLNLIQNTEKYEISKALIYDYEDLLHVSLSPNEKYLLVGTSSQVYLYDILTKLNRKIHKGYTYNRLFLQNSKQIVLQATKKIIIININTNKKYQLTKK